MTYQTITESGQLKLRDKEGNTIVFLHSEEVSDGVIVEGEDLEACKYEFKNVDGIFHYPITHCKFKHPELMKVEKQFDADNIMYSGCWTKAPNNDLEGYGRYDTRQIFKREEQVKEEPEEEIPLPVGEFILAQKDIVPAMTPNGSFYRYADVCTLLNRFKQQGYTISKKDGK